MQRGLRAECEAPKRFALYRTPYFFVVSFAAGAATHAPFPPFPPLASHVIFAFSQSALVFASVIAANEGGRRKSERHERQEEPLHGGSPYVIFGIKALAKMA